jgi:dolichol kinase
MADPAINGGGITWKVILRKLVHISGALILLVRWYMGLQVAQAVIIALAMLYLLSESQRLSGREMPFFTWLTRAGAYDDEQKGMVETPLWFAAGVFTTLSFFPFKHALIGVITLAVGDSVASLVGLSTRWRHPIPYNSSKSFEGTLAGIVAAFLVCSMFTDPQQSIVGCVVGMLVESLSLKLNDNVTIPISAATAVYALELFFSSG